MYNYHCSVIVYLRYVLLYVLYCMHGFSTLETVQIFVYIYMYKYMYILRSLSYIDGLAVPLLLHAVRIICKLGGCFDSLLNGPYSQAVF